MGMFVNNREPIEIEILSTSSIDEASAGIGGNPTSKYKILIRDKYSAGYGGKESQHWCSIKVTGGDFGDRGVPLFLANPLSNVETPNPNSWKSSQFKKLVYASRVFLDNLDLILMVWQGTSSDVQKAVAKDLESAMKSKDYDSNESLNPELRSRILAR